VQDELVEMSRLLREARLPVAALLARPELVLEQRVVLRPDYRKVVTHCRFVVFWRGSGRGRCDAMLATDIGIGVSSATVEGRKDCRRNRGPGTGSRSREAVLEAVVHPSSSSLIVIGIAGPDCLLAAVAATSIGEVVRRRIRLSYRPYPVTGWCSV